MAEKKTPVDKQLRELKKTNKLLKDMLEMLENIWRERSPQ